MQMPGWVPEYSMTSLLAGVGSLMRYRQWLDPATGRLAPAKMIAEGATAVGLGVGVIAVGSIWHVETPVLCGVSVFAGWLGPAAVGDLVLSKMGLKKGGPDA